MKLKKGKYTIVKQLGQGGFGITYLATTPTKVEGIVNGKKKTMTVTANVVVKEFFLKDYCTREENDSVTVASKGMTEMVGKYREKFKKEAIKLSQMSHPNIVEVTDVIEDENNTSYYVMRYLEGGTLYKLVRPDEKTITPLEEENAVRYIRQIASALGYMHKKSMCHFDVKPNNIMLDEDGNAVLIDFGLAKNYTKEGEQTSTLISGASVGYAPLEQANANLETFSPQTDIYALGATLYFLLTGHAPKAAAFNLSEVLPKGQCGISDNLWDVIKSCMQANPAARPQNIESFLHLLQGNRTLYKLICTDNEIKPLSEEAAVSYIKQIVKLLSLLSEREMLYFDVNPKKILLNEDKNIVSLSEGAQQETFSPQKGIYSLGATLYFLLTGRSPIISASNFSGVFPEGQCDISDSLWSVIQRCMHENPSNRPKDLDTFLRYLDGKEKEEPDGGHETDVIIAKNDKSNSFLNKSQTFFKKIKKSQLFVVSLVLVFGLFIALIYKYLPEIQPDIKKTSKIDSAEIVISEVQNITPIPSNDNLNDKRPIISTISNYKSPLGICSYTGPVDENGRPHGIGEASFSDGRSYKGPFVNGIFEGKDVYFRYDNGDTFQGEFQNNRFFSGKYTIKSDGSYFVGSFKNGQPDKGQWYDKNGIKI